MKKTYIIDGLECANCAAKMETAIGKIEGVESVNINFLSQKIVIEANEDNIDAIIKKAQKVVKKIESGAKIVA